MSHLSNTLIEYIEERSAVMEYDAGLPRNEAEKLALQEAAIKFNFVILDLTEKWTVHLGDTFL